MTGRSRKIETRAQESSPASKRRSGAPILIALLSGLVVLISCLPPEASSECDEGARACGASQLFEVVCEEGKWAVANCNADERCISDRCEPYRCEDGEKSCHGSKVVTCEDGWFSKPETCPDELTCEEGLCQPVICSPESSRCTGTGRIERCNARGTGWVDWNQCDPGEACVNGSCLPTGCEQGQKVCGSSSELYVCDDSQRWQASNCGEDRPCLFGRCVECLADDSCGSGERCDDGECVISLPEWETWRLPPGTEGVFYSASLKVRGGMEPIAFELASGELPQGLTLSPLGTLSGTPKSAGTFKLEVTATDNRENSSTTELELLVLPQGELKITTTSLKDAEMDYSYSFQLEAAGGSGPLAWQALQGLPEGLELTSSGKIHGTPSEIGDFPITFRVLDTQTPPLYALRDFVLKVKIAPLEIISNDSINLILTQAHTLPLILPVIPYNHQLQARGGLRPYTWSEIAPPSGLGFLISNWGLPDGLSLGSDGKITGSASNFDDATTVNIPGIGGLSGYFLHVRVEDSQSPADSDTAVLVIPTVPL